MTKLCVDAGYQEEAEFANISLLITEIAGFEKYVHGERETCSAFVMIMAKQVHLSVEGGSWRLWCPLPPLLLES